MVVKRRGGREWDKEMPHSEWINTVQAEPDVISMSFLPITSLLNGVPGCGFLNHAINLYLRCKFNSHYSFHVTDIILLLKFLPLTFLLVMSNFFYEFISNILGNSRSLSLGGLSHFTVPVVANCYAYFVILGSTLCL
jgi:hypothetical protein